ncbi:hypothetical protein BDV96DRAFT_564667 [Lophiotrema nucula]|uniref:SnoaL-like domain-containing protein n=1 Tax=Lophiotrema nucula TaxID=690887 RepID=A0A6A5ZQW9_9PLEO|nr:hypothetical protein BDV96DRAFT_564667 [Lophiotrema nucula]
MVNITTAAKAVAAGYALAISHGANYSIPLSTVADEVSTYFLPNYTSFTLGTINPLQNQSGIAAGFASLYELWRQEDQPGTKVHITKTKVRAVSDQSALCWLTYTIHPTNGMEKWSWTNVYGFRMVENGTGARRAGGWEFVIGDQEHQEYAKRFPETS